jgi:ribosomal protein L22
VKSTARNWADACPQRSAKATAAEGGHDVDEMVVRNILVDEGILDRDWRWD